MWPVTAGGHDGCNSAARSERLAGDERLNQEPAASLLEAGWAAECGGWRGATDRPRSGARLFACPAPCFIQRDHAMQWHPPPGSPALVGLLLAGSAPSASVRQLVITEDRRLPVGAPAPRAPSQKAGGRPEAWPGWIGFCRKHRHGTTGAVHPASRPAESTERAEAGSRCNHSYKSPRRSAQRLGP